ncbi:hypothetical protein D3C74_416480 [compost metagenome]
MRTSMVRTWKGLYKMDIELRLIRVEDLASGWKKHLICKQTRISRWVRGSSPVCS